MPQATESQWSNRYALPRTIENQPRVDGQIRYSVILANGARYTLCRPQSAEDLASWAPQPMHRTVNRGRIGSLNRDEGAL